jgi:hypothetical protein
MINEQQQIPDVAPGDTHMREQIEADVKQVMAAISVLLTGASGKDGNFGRRDDLMLIAGAPLAGPSLLWLGDMARASAQHVLHVSMNVGSNVPNIAMAVIEGDHVTIFEHCMLTLEKHGQTMTIVPDSFKEGGYRIGRNGKLKRCGTLRSFAAATPAMKRAYIRFHELRAGLNATSVAPIHFNSRG